jgi:Ca2+-binding RTX toxin-like protein
MLLLATMALTLLVASGVALAVTKIGTNGPDTLRGTNGDDRLVGKGGQDDIFALAGDDSLLGGPGKDYIAGGGVFLPRGGDKNLLGGSGNDFVGGGLGSDNIVGGDGNDFLLGGEFVTPAAKDIISGEAGNDVIEVINNPAGEDIVTCGSGVDRVWADRDDLIAPDCERVFVGEGAHDAFAESIPPSFFEGLPPLPSN